MNETLLMSLAFGLALLLNTLTFVFVIGALLRLRVSELRVAPRATGRGGIREGFAYVRHRSDIQLVMVLVFVLGTFGMNFQITMALMATKVFDKGAGEFGLLGDFVRRGEQHPETDRLRHTVLVELFLVDDGQNSSPRPGLRV